MLTPKGKPSQKLENKNSLGIGNILANILGLSKNYKSIQQMISVFELDRKMVSSKKSLVLQNLEDQTKDTADDFVIKQLQSRNFDMGLSQVWNPNIASKFQKGFFSLDDATNENAVVDFADEKFGGGVIGPNGFAQEEKMILETNLLSQAGKYKNLDTHPLYIQALQTHKFYSKGKYLYGNSKYGTKGNNTIDKTRIHKNNIGEYYKKTYDRKVNIIAMAAINFSKEKSKYYTEKHLSQMFDTALISFQKHAENNGKLVHSGAWGAGIFKNSENVTCVLQILAAQAAGVQLIYHGDENAYNSAVRFLKGDYIKGKSYTEVFKSIEGYMQKKHKNRDFWKPNKK